MAEQISNRAAFSLKVVLALVVVGVFSFSAFFTLSAYAPDLTSGDDGGAHALSQSAVGFAAAVELAKAQGADVTVSRTPLDDMRRTALYVLAPEVELDEAALAPVSNQRVLIILPKWGVAPNLAHRGWVVRVGRIDPSAAASVVTGLAKNVQVAQDTTTAPPRLAFAASSVLGRGDALTPGPIDHLQTISAAGLEPVVTTADGRIVLGRIADRPVYVLADPDLLNTQGLANIDTARAGMAILDALRDAGEPIVFDVTMNGFARERSLLRLALEPPFLAATLSLVAVALLLAWRAFTRVGPPAPPRRAIPLGKRALAENSAALIRLAHREHRMGRGYAMLTSAGLSELLGLPRGEGEQNIEVMDRVGAAQGVETRFSDLAAEASAAETGAQALAAARKLHSWKEEMLRATR